MSMNVSAPSVIRNYKPFFYPCSSGLRRLFSLTSLRSFCLRLPRATLPKTVNGLWSRHATRFLLAAHQSPQAVSGFAGSVGCEQREPEKLFEMLAHLLSLPGIPFSLTVLFCNDRGLTNCIGRKSPLPLQNKEQAQCKRTAETEAHTAARKFLWFFLFKEITVASNQNVRNKRTIDITVSRGTLWGKGWFRI